MGFLINNVGSPLASMIRVAAICRFIAIDHWRQTHERSRAGGWRQGIGRIDQIGVDVVGRGGCAIFVKDGLVARLEVFQLAVGVATETDDDAVDGGHAARLVAPFEGAVGEVDLDVVIGHQGLPEDGDLLALADGVGGDKGDAGGGALDQSGRLLEPGGDKVEVLVFGEDYAISAFLFRGGEGEADERGVAEDVVKGAGRVTTVEVGPVGGEGVGADDVGAAAMGMRA